MRGPCAECRVPIPVEDLMPRDGRSLCPRCFALTTPARLAAAPAMRHRGSGPAAAAPAAVAVLPPRGARVARAGRRSRAGRSGSAWAEAGPDGVGLLPRLEASVRAWAGGRYWWIRAPLLAWLVGILFQAWDAPWYRSLWAGLNLAFHEIGHYVWAPLGDFMAAAGGTLTQCLIPVAAGAMLYRQRDWFGVAVATCWLGINCFEVVEYAADAAARQLPLVSPAAGEPIHDWWYMLSRLGALHLHEQVAGAWQWAGRVITTGGVVFGGWVLWLMATTPAAASAKGDRTDVGPTQL